MDDLNILVTNDDGIDSVGFHALYEELSTIGSVTAVAPAVDQSAVGRAISQSVAVREHERGYVIEGTPVDCVVTGLSSLVPETDIVVAGCNEGANMGAPVLGRSGTVSAAVEAAFLGVPAIATSLYIPSPHWEKGDPVASRQFASAVEATSYLTRHAMETGVFDEIDYLNVNAPMTEESTDEMVLTRPSDVYELSSEREKEEIRLTNSIWEKLERGDISDPEGTDRRAILEKKISVSPLTAPHTTKNNDRLKDLVTGYTPTV